MRGIEFFSASDCINFLSSPSMAMLLGPLSTSTSYFAMQTVNMPNKRKLVSMSDKLASMSSSKSQRDSQLQSTSDNTPQSSRSVSMIPRTQSVSNAGRPPLPRSRNRSIEVQSESQPAASQPESQPAASQPDSQPAASQRESQLQSGSGTTLSRCGRGNAVGLSEWGQPNFHLALEFNNLMQPIGPNEPKLFSQIGCLVRDPTLAPLNTVSWSSMPQDRLDAIWVQVKSNTNAPDEYRRNCLMKAGDHWKKWKSRIKKTYFIPNKDSPAKLKEPPNDNRIDTNQWNELVSYWSNEDVEMMAEKNRKNRFELDANHRLGRKSMARIRLEMEINNEDTSRANMFIKSRERKECAPPDEIADEMIEQIKKKLNEVSEEERTEEYKEKVYLDIVGPDKLSHGRVRLYGYGPSPTAVFGASSSSSRECSSSSTVHTLEQFDIRMQDHEKRMAEEMERLARRQREIEEELERRKMELEAEHSQRKNEMNIMMDLLKQQLGVSGGVQFNISPRQSPLHKSSVGTAASPVGDVRRELISPADAIMAHTKDKRKEVLPEEEMSEKSNEDK